MSRIGLLSASRTFLSVLVASSTVVAKSGQASPKAIQALSAASTASADLATASSPVQVPVLLLHGIFDDRSKMAALDRYLGTHGFARRFRISMEPSDGSARLEVLAGQVSREVDLILRSTGAPDVDIVAFSMGGEIARYYLQRMGGLAKVRRFVTLSSPHHGTLTAFADFNPGAEEMRPGSPFVDDLNRDTSGLARHDCTSIWTPFDLMIVPAYSSKVSWAKNVEVPVLLHPLMVSDSRVMAAVAHALTEPDSDWARSTP